MMNEEFANSLRGAVKDVVLQRTRQAINDLRALEGGPEGRFETIEKLLSLVRRLTDEVEMDRTEFVEKARRVVEARGEPFCSGLRYRDDVIEIMTNFNGLDLQVEWVVGSNPVTMVSKGEIIRHHGEHIYLTRHLADLFGAICLSGVIPHTYIDCSEDPGAYAADLINRQAVTVEFAHEHLCDEPVWLFSETKADMGLDPWTLLAGIDKRTDGTAYFVEWGIIDAMEVPPGFRVYAQRKTLRKLGLPEGKPGGPADFPTKPSRL